MCRYTQGEALEQDASDPDTLVERNAAALKASKKPARGRRVFGNERARVVQAGRSLQADVRIGGGGSASGILRVPAAVC